ncbi:pyridoxal-phosphate dependent enzyme [Dactylosporangium sp. NBC_01737]|uniref:threonine ammonia-lyase n=1 Tax=Dactylosporangium sp. NBC_01737 TaxID=2975959 RepID=UPI002E109130|nr:pyridoxal-phosphate dependent enzyme [Dactylosporangium sp. NBC_01737]
MITLNDVLRARRLLAGHLPPTPSWSYPLLDEAAGRTVVVKHENAQPTGAFKVRGALNLLAGLDRGQPVVTYSTGNHARSVAYAARAFGIPAHVVMPAGAAGFKVRAVRALGATVTLHGADMSEAEAHAATLGGRLISPGDEPAVIAGVGTAYLELFERHPDLDTVVVPVGSGTGAGAACVVAAAVAPGCRVIGVQWPPRRPRTTRGGPAPASAATTAPASTASPPAAGSSCRSRCCGSGSPTSSSSTTTPSTRPAACSPAPRTPRRRAPAPRPSPPCSPVPT